MIQSQVFQVKRPVYPLIAVCAALIVLLCGFSVSMSAKAVAAYILALSLIYIIFGYWKVFWKVFLIFAVLGLISAIGTLVKHNYVTSVVTVCRFLVLGLSSVTLISTKAISLTRSLNSIHIPRALTLGMLVTIRFIPILRSEVRRVRDAMKTRGVGSGVSTLYRAFLLPFVMQIINLSDILAISVETRGFDLSAKEASIYKKVPLTARDIVFAVILVLVSVAAIIGRVVLK